MDWIFAMVVVAVVAGVFALKRMSLVSADRAQAMLRDGALVVDVRNPDEFRGGSVPGAINIPLSELESDAPRKLPDKTRPVLVHCLSGGRSAFAQRKLKRLGYAQVANLGSFGRAAAMVGQARQTGRRPL